MSRIASFSEGAFSSRDSVTVNTGSRPCLAAARKREGPSGINAQSVEIVGIFISAGNRQDAGADHVRQRVRDAQRVAAIGKTAPISIPNRRSAIASSMTPPSEVSRPPSKAAVTAFRPTAGNENGGRLKSDMASGCWGARRDGSV